MINTFSQHVDSDATLVFGNTASKTFFETESMTLFDAGSVTFFEVSDISVVFPDLFHFFFCQHIVQKAHDLTTVFFEEVPEYVFFHALGDCLGYCSVKVVRSLVVHLGDVYQLAVVGEQPAFFQQLSAFLVIDVDDPDV